MSDLPRLLLVTDRCRTAGRELMDLVMRAVAGGLRWIQLREKDLDPAECEALASELRRRLPPGVLLSLNGRPELARRLAAGLHLPADVATPSRPCRPLGRSVHEPGEARRAAVDRPDYLIAGNVYATPSKPGRAGAGPALLTEVLRVAPVPVFAIGGIDADRVGAVLEAGAYGVAVCGAVLSAADPAAETRRLCAALETPTARRRALTEVGDGPAT